MRKKSDSKFLRQPQMESWRRTNGDRTLALLWKICFFTEERIFFSFLTEFVVGQSWILFRKGHSANVRDCIGLQGGDSLA